MRLAVLDASPLGGGPLTRALVCMAADIPDAQVVRIRLFDVSAKACSMCDGCATTGRCSRHHPALADALASLTACDALVVGTVGHLQARDPRYRALLERLVGAFGRIETARGLSHRRAALDAARGSHKRAALLCAAPPLLGVPAMLGMLPAGVASVWRVLERSGATVVGCATVGARFSGPASFDRAGSTARKLAVRLVGPGRGVRVPAGAQPRTLPTSPLPGAAPRPA